MSRRSFHKRPTGLGAEGYGRARAAVEHVDPAKAWRGFTDEVKAFVAGAGERPALQMLEKRRQACGAKPPFDGEAAKAASNAMLELVRTWTHAPEEQHGWRLQTLGAVAAEVSALLDQRDFAAAQLGRRCAGGDD